MDSGGHLVNIKPDINTTFNTMTTPAFLTTTKSVSNSSANSYLKFISIEFYMNQDPFYYFGSNINIQHLQSDDLNVKYICMDSSYQYAESKLVKLSN